MPSKSSHLPTTTKTSLIVMTPLRSPTTTNPIRVDTKLQPGHIGLILASPVMVLLMGELRLPVLGLRITFSTGKAMEVKPFMLPYLIKVATFTTLRSLRTFQSPISLRGGTTSQTGMGINPQPGSRFQSPHQVTELTSMRPTMTYKFL